MKELAANDLQTDDGKEFYAMCNNTEWVFSVNPHGADISKSVDGEPWQDLGFYSWHELRTINVAITRLLWKTSTSASSQLQRLANHCIECLLPQFVHQKAPNTWSTQNYASPRITQIQLTDKGLTIDIKDQVYNINFYMHPSMFKELNTPVWDKITDGKTHTLERT